MDEKQILERQVEALEKLLQLRSAIIEELEAKVSRLENQGGAHFPGVNVPWVSSPYIGYPQSSSVIVTNTCPDGSPHQYPSLWGGTTNPPCAKCGMCIGTAQGNIVISGNTTSIPMQTSGYIQPVTSQTLSVDGITTTVTHGNLFTLTAAAK